MKKPTFNNQSRKVDLTTIHLLDGIDTNKASQKKAARESALTVFEKSFDFVQGFELTSAMINSFNRALEYFNNGHYDWAETTLEFHILDSDAWHRRPKDLQRYSKYATMAQIKAKLGKLSAKKLVLSCRDVTYQKWGTTGHAGTLSSSTL